MNPLPEVDQLRWSPEMTTPIRPSSRPPRHQPGKPFLKGPIPWNWLDLAGRLPGKALAVGLVLWQKAGITERRTVHICQATQSELGLNKDSTRRAITELERAGLITVRRRSGRGLDVTLCDVRPELGAESNRHEISHPIDSVTQFRNVVSSTDCVASSKGDASSLRSEQPSPDEH
jgi:hypothetical protein